MEEAIWRSRPAPRRDGLLFTILNRTRGHGSRVVRPPFAVTALSPDGSVLAAVGAQGFLDVFFLLQNRHVMVGHVSGGTPTSVCVGRGGGSVRGGRNVEVFVGCADGCVRVFSVNVGPSGLRERGGRLVVPSTTAESARAGGDGRIGVLVATLRGHRRAVTNVHLSSDGATLLTASQDCAVLWDTSKWERRRALRSRARVVGCALSETAGDGSDVVCVAFGDDSIGVWSANSCATVAKLTVPTGERSGRGGLLTCVACDGKRGLVAAGCRTGSVLLWDLVSEKALRVLDLPPSSAAIIGVACLPPSDSLFEYGDHSSRSSSSPDPLAGARFAILGDDGIVLIVETDAAGGSTALAAVSTTTETSSSSSPAPPIVAMASAQVSAPTSRPRRRPASAAARRLAPTSPAPPQLLACLLSNGALSLYDLTPPLLLREKQRARERLQREEGGDDEEGGSYVASQVAGRLRRMRQRQGGSGGGGEEGRSGDGEGEKMESQVVATAFPRRRAHGSMGIPDAVGGVSGSLLAPESGAWTAGATVEDEIQVEEEKRDEEESGGFLSSATLKRRARRHKMAADLWAAQRLAESERPYSTSATAPAPHSAPPPVGPQPVWKVGGDGKGRGASLTQSGLRRVLQRRGSFPDDVRSAAWRFLMRLPANEAAARDLLAAGTHPAASAALKRFPVRDVRAARRLGRLVSCLAHWCPAVGCCPFLPMLVYPLLSVFGPGQDIAALEAALFLFFNPARRWLQLFPHPPAPTLAATHTALALTDPELATALDEANISPTTAIWPLLRSLFSEILPRPQWMALWDNIIAFYPQEPNLILACAVALLRYHRSSILRILQSPSSSHHRSSKAAISDFLRSHQPTNVRDLLSLARITLSAVPSSLWNAPVFPGDEVADEGEGEEEEEEGEGSEEKEKKASRTQVYWVERGRTYAPFLRFPAYAVDFQLRERERIAAEEAALQRRRAAAAAAEHRASLAEASGAVEARARAVAWEAAESARATRQSAMMERTARAEAVERRSLEAERRAAAAREAAEAEALRSARLRRTIAEREAEEALEEEWAEDVRRKHAEALRGSARVRAAEADTRYSEMRVLRTAEEDAARSARLRATAAREKALAEAKAAATRVSEEVGADARRIARERVLWAREYARQVAMEEAEAGAIAAQARTKAEFDALLARGESHLAASVQRAAWEAEEEARADAEAIQSASAWERRKLDKKQKELLEEAKLQQEAARRRTEAIEAAAAAEQRAHAARMAHLAAARREKEAASIALGASKRVSRATRDHEAHLHAQETIRARPLHPHIDERSGMYEEEEEGGGEGEGDAWLDEHGAAEAAAADAVLDDDGKEDDTGGDLADDEDSFDGAALRSTEGSGGRLVHSPGLEELPLPSEEVLRSSQGGLSIGTTKASPEGRTTLVRGGASTDTRGRTRTESRK